MLRRLSSSTRQPKGKTAETKLKATVAESVVAIPAGTTKRLSVEHPSGEFTVELDLDDSGEGDPRIRRAGLLRTARRIFDGQVFVPETLLSKGSGIEAA